MGDGWTIWPQKYREQKAVFSHEKIFHSVACKNRLDSGTGLVNPVTAARRRHLHLPYPEARDPGRHGQPRVLTLLRVDQDRGAHILQLLFSVPVGPYNPNRRLFGCRREIFLRDSL